MGSRGKAPGLALPRHKPTPDFILALDAADKLAAQRQQFHLPPDTIYLDGNSLGAMPRATLQRQSDILRQEWGDSLIRGWNDHDWIGAPSRIGTKIARLIGAQPDEVIAADSTSVNLFKLITAAARAQPGRSTLLMEAGDFPTDLHIAAGIAALLPDTRLVRAPPGGLAEAIDDTTAIVVLSHVRYITGQRQDMSAITQAAHRQGALILWDLSHSTGAIPVDLNRHDVDLAVGCGYKFLNGGPGAPAYLFVARRLQDRLANPIQGWMGHASVFGFSGDYQPAEGIRRFLCGTPPMLSLLALETGIDLMLPINPASLFTKSAALFDIVADAVEQSGRTLKRLTPRAPEARGSHIAFTHPDSETILRALAARRVIGDFRPPDVMRFGLTPLYLSHEDAWQAAQHLIACVN